MKGRGKLSLKCFFRGCHRLTDTPNLRRLASELAIPAELW